MVNKKIKYYYNYSSNKGAIKIEIISKRNKILELKSTIIKMQNILERINGRFEVVEERISKPEDKSVEITQSKEQQQKNKK